ncbi:hypothetical protein ACWEQN_48620 [Streptomyces sp. NPDC004129]
MGKIRIAMKQDIFVQECLAPQVELPVPGREVVRLGELVVLGGILVLEIVQQNVRLAQHEVECELLGRAARQWGAASCRSAARSSTARTIAMRHAIPCPSQMGGRSYA